MIAGMVRALGDGYQFEPLGPPPPSPVNVETPSLMNKTVVYALVPRLSAATQALVADALRAARADNAVTGLLLDLRGAGGGTIDELVRFADMFIDHGVVLAARERRTRNLSEREATQRPPAETLPMVILVDDATNSGAEGLAGTLRARQRALVIGRRTAGKAAVTTIIDLPSGSRLVVPTGDLVEPGVGVISGRGVQPDIDLGARARRQHERQGGEPDEAIRFGFEVLRGARSAARRDLLVAAQRIEAARPAPK